MTTNNIFTSDPFFIELIINKICVLLRAPENRNDTSHNDPKYNALYDYNLGICFYTPPNKSNKCKKTNNKTNATKQTKNYLEAVEALL